MSSSVHEGLRARRAVHCRSCTTTPIVWSARCGVSMAPYENSRGTTCSTTSSTAVGDHRRAVRRPWACSSAAASAGAARYRMQEALFRHRHAGEVQPADHRRDGEDARRAPRRRLPGIHVARRLRSARMVLYIGVNPVVSHGHNIGLADPLASIRALARRAEVWVVDPRLSETATRGAAPRARPGADYAVLAFVVRRPPARRRRRRDQWSRDRTTSWPSRSSRSSSTQPTCRGSPRPNCSICWRPSGAGPVRSTPAPA